MCIALSLKESGLYPLHGQLCSRCSPFLRVHFHLVFHCPNPPFSDPTENISQDYLLDYETKQPCLLAKPRFIERSESDKKKPVVLATRIKCTS